MGEKSRDFFQAVFTDLRHTPVLSLGSIYLSLLVSDPPVELLPFEAQEVFSRVDDAALDGDGTRSVDVVPGDHAHGDPGSLALPDGFWHLREQGKGTENSWIRAQTQRRCSHPEKFQAKKFLKQKDESDAFCCYLTVVELGLHHGQGKSCIRKHKNHLLDQFPKFSPGLNKNECSAAFLTFNKLNLTTQHV